jgi:hypothetical protein
MAFNSETVTTLPRWLREHPAAAEQDCAMPVWSLVLRRIIASRALRLPAGDTKR